MLKKLIKRLGYVPVSELLEKQNEIKNQQIVIASHQKNLEIADDFEYYIPEVDYKEYAIQVNGKAVYHSETWRTWYDKYQRNPHSSYIIRNLSRYPEHLMAFLTKFGSFNWEEIEDYMKKVNWCWSDRKTTPTIFELQTCVISLIDTKRIENEGLSWASSGGFEVVIRKNDNGEIYSEISFDKMLKFNA